MSVPPDETSVERSIEDFAEEISREHRAASGLAKEIAIFAIGKSSDPVLALSALNIASEMVRAYDLAESVAKNNRFLKR